MKGAQKHLLHAFVRFFVLRLCLNLACLRASVTKRRLAVVADMLTAERMTALSLRESSVATLESVCPCRLLLRWQLLLVRCEYARLGGKNAESYNCTQDIFNVCVPVEDVEVCEKVTFIVHLQLLLLCQCCLPTPF